MAYSIFENVNFEPNPIIKVNRKDYLDWESEYVFDALKGFTMGQSFANRFDITDYLLDGDLGVEFTKKYIKSTYLA